MPLFTAEVYHGDLVISCSQGKERKQSSKQPALHS